MNVALIISDLLSITMEDIRILDFENPMLNVRESKTGKLRSILLNTAAMSIVQRRLRENSHHTWLFQSKRRTSALEAPKPISRRSVARVFATFGREVVPRVQLSPHTMRKTRGHARIWQGTA